jgi:hypothetical protein
MNPREKAREVLQSDIRSAHEVLARHLKDAERQLEWLAKNDRDLDPLALPQLRSLWTKVQERRR